ncbi:MAG: hypothetical protein Q8Q14_10755 [Gemmatimonadales bacterium]|nr:hypothetical protein [Gemmatimonadales bacterium]
MGMPDKFWLKNVAIGGGINFGSMQRNGTQPATVGATWGTGWTAGTTPAGNFSGMSFGVERAAATFGATPLPNAVPDSSLGDAWRTETALSVTYLADWWSLSSFWVPVTVGAGLDVRLRSRLWKGAAADGSDAVPLTDVIVSPTMMNLATGGTVYSASVNAQLPRVVFDGEHLFWQWAMEIVGAATNVNADVLHRNHPTYQGIDTPQIEDSSRFYSLSVSPTADNYCSAMVLRGNDYSPNSTYSPATAHTVGTTAPTKYSWMNYQVTQAVGTFGATPLPDGTAPQTSSPRDSYRTKDPCDFDADPCTWEMSCCARALSNASGQDGRWRYRLWAGAAPDGSDAVEIGGGTLIGTTLTNLPRADTVPPQPVLPNSIATVALGALSLHGKYVFLQMAWEITGAATSASANVLQVHNFTPNRVGLSIPAIVPWVEPTQQRRRAFRFRRWNKR